MLRLFALLLFFIPLQFSWTVVASYCSHESQVKEAHFGHHSHQHHDVTNDDSTGIFVSNYSAVSSDLSANTLLAIDLDCKNCHGTCHWFFDLAQVVSNGSRFASNISPYGDHWSTVFARQPERPQWWRLA